MADFGTRYTDKQADKLDAEIAKVYKEAQADIQRKMNEFYKGYAERARKKKADLDAGKITLQEYQKWLRGQVFQSQRWKEKRDSIAKTLTEADRKAAQIINKHTPDVFRENANFTAYDIERGTKGGVSFNLYDSKTVEKLIKDKPELLPRRVIDGRKADAWNRKEIANAVSQGIIQGESIPKLAARIARDTGIKNGNSSMLYARTAMTGAQNAGRQERLEDAQRMGIEVKKKWLATLDNRTRDTHQKLDGQEVAVNESFEVDGMKIDYPGDPTADPSLVYNCRCTLIYVYPKYQHLQHAKRYDQEAGKLIENMTYKEWGRAKQQAKKAYSFDDDTSFAASLQQELSPYSYEIPTYKEYREQREAWGNRKTTKYIEDVKPGTVIDFKSDYSFYGEPHCAASRVDNAVARCQEKVRLFRNREKLIVCDYDHAHYYLPDGDSDRRLTTDAIAQVFQNNNQTVIAVNRNWMTGTLQESLESRAVAITKGAILDNVFPVRSPEGVILHEWGHTVHDYFLDAMCYDDKNAQGLWDWFNTLSKEDIRTGISEYATTNFGEFCAECFAEMQAENPRPIAKKWWKYMKPIIERGGYNE